MIMGDQQGRCASCRFYDPFSGACWNGVSEHYTRFVPSYGDCKEYVTLEDEEE